MSHSSSASGHKTIPKWELAALASLALGTVIIGTIGQLKYAELHGHQLDVFTAIYYSGELLFYKSGHLAYPIPVSLQIGRWTGLVFALWASTKIIVALFRSQYNGLRRSFLKEHTVICGLSQRTLPLLTSWRGSQPLVVIDRSPQPDLLHFCEKHKIHVVTGDATQKETLIQAGVARARTLVALCPEDSVNCEIAAQARSLDRKISAGKLMCHVHLTDANLRHQLRRNITDDSSATDITFFDLFDTGARHLLRESMPLDRSGLRLNDQRQPHLIIIGCGRSGQALLLRAAQVAHFANGRQLRVTIVDRKALLKRDALLFRHPAYLKVCEIEFIQSEAETPAIRELIEKICRDATQLTSIAICFDQEARATELALKFLSLLQTTDSRAAVRLAHSTGLAGILKELIPTHSTTGNTIIPFGMYADFCLPSLLANNIAERLAQILHASFVEAQLAKGKSPNEPKLRKWAFIPETLRDSNRQQAEHVFVKLRTVGCAMVSHSDPRPAVNAFSPDELEMLSQMEHARWVAERLLDGWTSAPLPVNYEIKTTPWLIDWAILPEEIRQYDRDFIIALPALLKKMDLKIIRLK